MAFHFAEANANVLTTEAGDPVTQTPELKHCAIRIEKLPAESTASAAPAPRPDQGPATLRSGGPAGQGPSVTVARDPAGPTAIAWREDHRPPASPPTRAW